MARRSDVGTITTGYEGDGTPSVGRSSGLPWAKPAAGSSEP